MAHLQGYAECTGRYSRMCDRFREWTGGILWLICLSLMTMWLIQFGKPVSDLFSHIEKFAEDAIVSDSALVSTLFHVSSPIHSGHSFFLSNSDFSMTLGASCNCFALCATTRSIQWTRMMTSSVSMAALDGRSRLDFTSLLPSQSDCFVKVSFYFTCFYLYFNSIHVLISCWYFRSAQDHWGC